ncbi:hypothetical protein GQ53DRAFT_356033 [Thozetella sp. PMI_491]|nr:hypothetical protein GQ53DRAFT_356033 [Thozetella sp. PMI_491]
MAPGTPFVESLGLLARDVADPTEDWGPTELSYDRIVRVLTSLSLSLGLVSVLSTLVAFYWFVKMKRSFRHDLIMLLIQSDLVKSVWFVIFPIVNFIGGPVRSESAFCQVSGFFLTVGIESSDLAVLLIAIHSVMYILRPGSGLYPYRRIAYAAYIIIPSALASLAFINGQGYQNVGHYCYLRTDYPWARLALSWVPRYVLLVMVVIIYLFLYIYVSHMMGTYDRRASGNFTHGRRDCLSTDGPPIPPIAYHGLIPSTPSSRRPSGIDNAERHRSDSSVSTIDLGTAALGGPQNEQERTAKPGKPLDWDWRGFRHPFASPDGTTKGQDLEEPVSPTTAGPRVPPPAVHPSSPRSEISPHDVDDLSDVSSGKSLPGQSFWRRPLSSMTPGALSSEPNSPNLDSKRKGSQPNMLSVLRRGPQSIPSISVSPSILVDDTGITHNQKMQYQLWSFFLYPLVYIIIWVFPFVSHILGYDDAITAEDPQWLLMLSIISLCVQGTVDCMLFSIREKPWKHMKGGFWKNLAKRLTWNWCDVRIPGRTREEMLVDGRLARARRNQEIAQEANARDIHGAKKKKKGGREWWDLEFKKLFDGPSKNGGRAAEEGQTV